jgi:hypothetical protein
MVKMSDAGSVKFWSIKSDDVTCLLHDIATVALLGIILPASEISITKQQFLTEKSHKKCCHFQLLKRCSATVLLLST